MQRAQGEGEGETREGGMGTLEGGPRESGECPSRGLHVQDHVHAAYWGSSLGTIKTERVFSVTVIRSVSCSAQCIPRCRLDAFPVTAQPSARDDVTAVERSESSALDPSTTQVLAGVLLAPTPYSLYFVLLPKKQALAF